MATNNTSSQTSRIRTRRDYEKTLGLLEAYEKALKSSEDDNDELQAQVQALKGILKSNLFGALVDIQEYYEDILRDISKNPEIAKQEAELLSNRWNENGAKENEAT